MGSEPVKNYAMQDFSWRQVVGVVCRSENAWTLLHVTCKTRLSRVLHFNRVSALFPTLSVRGCSCCGFNPSDGAFDWLELKQPISHPIAVVYRAVTVDFLLYLYL